MFDPSLLMPALAAAGMTRRVERLDHAGASFECGFLQPSELLLGDEIHTDRITIEYVSTEAPDLARGESLDIAGTRYTVRGPAMAEGDGYFSRIELERTR